MELSIRGPVVPIAAQVLDEEDHVPNPMLDAKRVTLITKTSRSYDRNTLLALASNPVVGCMEAFAWSSI